MATSRVQIVSWEPIVFWKFKTSNDECQICKEHFEAPCLSCIDKKDTVTCDVSRGKCGHCYHKHCIDQWLSKSSICPGCMTPYTTEVSNMNSNDSYKKTKLPKK